jgi:hypothetical protein
MGGPDEDPIEWDSAPSQEWFDAVEGWPWEDRDGDWIKHGSCPRCGHHMDRTVAGGIAYALPPPAPQPVAIWCNCTAAHPHRPTDRGAGCGANARVSPPPSP